MKNLKSWFDELLPDFDMSKVSTKSTGMDYYLSNGDSTSGNLELFATRSASKEELSKGRIRVSSVQQLKGFTRVASTDTLIRMSEQDLWSLTEDEETGEFLVERLFDDDGGPLKV